MLGAWFLLHKAYNKVRNTVSRTSTSTTFTMFLTGQIHEVGHLGYSTNLASPQGAVFMYK
jgi:Zn-dependent M32 family carboxypeptidase